MLDGFSRETCLERKSGFSVCRWNCRGLRPLSLSITAMIEKRSCRAHIHFDIILIQPPFPIHGVQGIFPHLFILVFFPLLNHSLCLPPAVLIVNCPLMQGMSCSKLLSEKTIPPADQKISQALAASLSTPQVMPCLREQSCSCYCTKLGTVVAQVVDESILKCCHLLITSVDTLLKS